MLIWALPWALARHTLAFRNQPKRKSERHSPHRVQQTPFFEAGACLQDEGRPPGCE